MDIVTDERRLKREKGQDRSENVEKDDGNEAFGKFVNLRTKRPVMLKTTKDRIYRHLV